jgi:hypothetical protein
VAAEKNRFGIELRVSRVTARRLLVVTGALVVLGAGARLTLAVPVSFTDGNVLTAQQLNDNFADIDQRLTALAGHDVAGTRLKGKYVTGSDGTKQYVKDVWYDSQLGVDCRFQHAADDKIRCLPTGANSTTSVMRYQDSLCSQPLIGYTQTLIAGCAAGPLPKYVLVPLEFPQSPVCPTNDPILDATPAYHVYTLGTYSGAPGTYLLNGNCQGNSGLGASTWHVGAEVDATTFVEATNGVDP